MNATPTDTTISGLAASLSPAAALLASPLATDRNAPTSSDAASVSPDAMQAVTEVNQLLGLLADVANDPETVNNPDALREAQNAIQICRQAKAEITSASRQPGGAQHIQFILRAAQQSVTNSLSHIAAEEADDQNSKVSAHAPIIASAQTKRVTAKTPPRTHAPAEPHDPDEIISTGRRMSAAEKRAYDEEQATKRKTDESDAVRYVHDKKGRRYERKMTSEAGRNAVWAANNATFGLLGAQNIDEAISTATTGTEAVVEGATAVLSGDHVEIDRLGLKTGRGVRNAAEDIGLSAETAQTIGHATTATAQFVGHKVAHVRNGAAAIANNAVSGAQAVGRQVANKADSARDAAADKYQQMWKFGREINDLLPALQKTKYAKSFDADGDGKAELHEVVAKLKSMGITDIDDLDRNKDGNISAQEFATGALGRMKPQAKGK